MNLAFKNYLLKTTKASACEEVEIIQSLWSGYGRISRYLLGGSSVKTVVVKYISLHKVEEHPRGWNSSYAHNRKLKSYEVETYWYQQWNERCDDCCAVPKFLGSYTEGKNQWIILEDLDENYPIRKEHIDLLEVKVCLKWLANFHGVFLNEKPNNLWEIGTYWNLETRPDEFKKIEHQELKSKARHIDKVLNECSYQTIIHGDAKLANFCFSENGEKVAAVDFQYVGGGCGMKDIAYFLGSCLSSSECEMYQNELLNFYFIELEKAVKDINFKDLEHEWRKMYSFACADFTRFLMGWMPSHQKVNDYNLNLMKSVLANI
ncbi:MAG: DUF1679 domain-containing protein [Flavobacteriales bacterium]|nr:DUF1679 domain-containing protein [Flavobacteriales bacterium]